MNEKKDFCLSIIGLLIILVGAIVLILIDFPAGLLIILPSAIPHIIPIMEIWDLLLLTPNTNILWIRHILQIGRL